MTRHAAINIVKKEVDYLTRGQIPIVSVNQPLHAVTKQIQCNWPDTLGRGLKFGGLLKDDSHEEVW